MVEARAVGAEGAHLKLTLAQGGHRLGGIAFREGHRAEGLSGEVDALFVPKLNTYMGRTEAQVEVRAWATRTRWPDRWPQNLPKKPRFNAIS